MDPTENKSEPASGLAARAYPLVALAFSTIFVLTVATSVWVYYSQSPAVDFASFWAAGHLAITGQPALAYDIQAHRAVEMTVAHMGGLMPFPYPPPFLFMVSAIGFHPFWLAYLAWIVGTAALYLLATKRFLPPRYAFAHPAALMNAAIGQNGLLTTAIFACGASIVASQPYVGGAVLGLLVIKPQLGVLLPIALVADRNWRAIGAAAASSLLLLGAAAVVFGPDSYRGFFAITGEYTGYMAGSRWNWAELASLFAFLRYFGVPQSVALTIQGVAALAAAALTWRSWSTKAEERVAVLAAATLLVPPYLFTYDSLLLVLPLAFLLRDGRHPWRVAILWLLLLAPILAYFDLYPGPNTIPIAAILSLWWLAGPKAAPVPAPVAA
jgi:alpha-1,2-mannosyltransferase